MVAEDASWGEQAYEEQMKENIYNLNPKALIKAFVELDPEGCVKSMVELVRKDERKAIEKDVDGMYEFLDEAQVRVCVSKEKLKQLLKGEGK